ncbi:hypothetical protein [Enorma massiliensis]|uniref:hypothetical protein n=1 Tax=Enorma massiliensis TaxID=1472761 RepID=UPI003AF12788
MRRNYTCIMRHGDGFGGGYGGTYEREHSYQSTHRAGSKANEEGARTTWRRLHGNAGWCEVVPGSVRLESED